MTRDDVKKIFPDATDEQITSFLNKSNADVAKERTKAEKYKEDADKASELQKQLDEIEKQNMSDKELLEKENEDLKNNIAALTKANTLSEITSIFAKGGLSTELYASVIDAFSSLPKEDAIEKTNSFVAGITESNKTTLETAKAEWEKAGLMSGHNPNSAGDNNKGGEPEKSKAGEYAKQRSQRMGNVANSNENAPVNF